MARSKRAPKRSVNTPGQGGRVRIIGGEWRGRWLQFSGDPTLRPSGDRLRETLFNWLQFELHGARCLDLFAGSGALGFEALSRGATQLTQVEPHPAAQRSLRENAALLGADKRTQLVGGRAQDFLASTSESFDIVFLDPPFALDLLNEVFNALEQGDLLAPQAWIYLEQAVDAKIPEPPASWRLKREKRQGQVAARLYRKEICCSAA